MRSKVVPTEPTTNGFCPTGKGGGVDPTCGVGAGKKVPTGGKVGKIKKTEYTLKELDAAADKTGHEMFDGDKIKYQSIKAKKIVRVKLSKHVKDPEMDDGVKMLDEYEHVFFPSQPGKKAKHPNVSAFGWDQATKDWADVDGKIYTKYRDQITVVEVDGDPKKLGVKAKKAADASQKSAKKWVAPEKSDDEKLFMSLVPDKTKKVGKFDHGERVLLTDKSGLGGRYVKVLSVDGDEYETINYDGERVRHKGSFLSRIQ